MGGLLGRARALPTVFLIAACLCDPSAAAGPLSPPPGSVSPALGPLSPPPAGALQPLITTSELAVGRNRFAFALLRHGRALANADVAVHLYDIRDEDAQLAAVTAAVYHPVEVIDRGRHVHIHPDGTRHLHDASTDIRGIYVTELTFERAGPWGIEIVVRNGEGVVDSLRLSVEALDVSRAPMLGTAAPRSRNLTARDVKDLRRIDSSEPPDPRLHQTRIADAISQGRPQVIIFATPKYCTSRVCGPVLDVVRTLIPAYGKRVAFVHQEIWQSTPGAALAPTVEEWNLRSEPWTFVVDGKGVIRAKFEGLVTRRELEAVLTEVLAVD
jgi:hypothetical protein